ncbi:ferredoxin domain-containing protein [Pectinatus frisingensis]|uniref:ferredoxin domain-containing protein n=1 Tax=Pectinatus frisingensis TaxID=865 RepID=UPI0018C83390|nr:DUF2148 domain-containing protein [Pectinatus frisingensis]
MLIMGNEAEEKVILAVAEKMCTAARTAPKTRGTDHILTCIITAEEKDRMAAEMERIGKENNLAFFLRDAKCIRSSAAVVLLGVRLSVRGLNEACGYCNFKNCQEALSNGALCAYDPMDLGIAIGSAVSVAVDNRIDNRVMFSAGRAGMNLKFLGGTARQVIGIPLAAKGKSPFFDRV